MSTSPTDHENLPKKILKALGVFGGMQGILILCSLIRVKLIAIFIGSEGVGLYAIFNNTIEMFRELTQLNIQQSAVRDVARHSTRSYVSAMAYIVTRWTWLLGVAGAFLLLVCSPFLSRYCFDSDDYTLSFAILSAVVFMQAIQTGWLILMQGTEKLVKLAKSQLWGAVIAICLCAPMFYLWGINSIIPSLLVYASTNLATTFFFRVHLPDPQPKPDRKEVMDRGKSFVKLGIFLTISTFSALLADFIFKSWLNVTASTAMVGFYTAGFTIVNRYVGMIFTAISVEYYPRLSRIIHSKDDVFNHVNQEISIALLVLTPLIVFFIPLSGFIVNILYSSEFLIIIPFISVAMIGTLYRAISWCLAYVILAKGDGRTYVVVELLSATTFLVLSILTYKYFGIKAMGYAYTLWFMLYFAYTATAYRFRYGYALASTTINLLILGSVLGAVSLVLVTYLHWIAGVVFAVAVSVPYTRRLIKVIRKG
ncbi:MAG: oligosaccharide flippase family protein [Muribaculaceae bacterium]|nr:oligosaccharide flippase family protein [Muribaculaceae bacterium]